MEPNSPIYNIDLTIEQSQTDKAISNPYSDNSFDKEVEFTAESKVNILFHIIQYRKSISIVLKKNNWMSGQIFIEFKKNFLHP